MVIDRIFICPARGAAQSECEQVTVHAGLGVVGDRNYRVHRHPGQNLTLVEAEEIERFCAQHARSVDLSLARRNLITRGVRLNELLDAEFLVGSVRLRGVELCEPCTILGDALKSASVSRAAAIRHWVGRGGLRVDVLTDGQITRGDRVARDA